MPITPDMFAGTPLEDTTELNEHPDNIFVLFVSPDSASVQTEGLESPTWLPELRTQRLAPGVLGAETADKGASPYSAIEPALVQMEARGLRVIEPGLEIPAEVTGTSAIKGYIVPHDCYHRLSGARGKCYRAFYERPVTRRRSNEPPRWVTDHAAKNRFALWLIEQGHVDAPDETIRLDVTREAEAWAEQQGVIEDPSKRADQVTKKAAHLKSIQEAVIPTVAAAATETAKRPRRSRTGA